MTGKQIAGVSILATLAVLGAWYWRSGGMIGKGDTGGAGGYIPPAAGRVLTVSGQLPASLDDGGTGAGDIETDPNGPLTILIDRDCSYYGTCDDLSGGY